MPHVFLIRTFIQSLVVSYFSIIIEYLYKIHYSAFIEYLYKYFRMGDTICGKSCVGIDGNIAI